MARQLTAPCPVDEHRNGGGEQCGCDCGECLRVGVFSGGGRQISRVPATRRSARWRSSSPSQSGGTGTKGNGIVHGRSRRLYFPGSVSGRVQRGRGWSWPRHPVRIGGPGVRELVSRIHRVSSVVWLGFVGLPVSAGAELGGGWYRGWFHHRRRPGGLPHATAHMRTHMNRLARSAVVVTTAAKRESDGGIRRTRQAPAGRVPANRSRPGLPGRCGGVAGVTGVTGSA
jgi:hypothetical protein